jgi:hypothetical protein
LPGLPVVETRNGLGLEHVLLGSAVLLDNIAKEVDNFGVQPG